jgi:hypothetical protein
MVVFHHLCGGKDFPVLQIELNWIASEVQPHEGRGVGTREELSMNVCA